MTDKKVYFYLFYFFKFIDFFFSVTTAVHTIIQTDGQINVKKKNLTLLGSYRSVESSGICSKSLAVFG